MLLCAALFSELKYFFLSMWVPDRGSVHQLGADQCVIGSLSYLLIFSSYVSLDEVQRPGGIFFLYPVDVGSRIGHWRYMVTHPLTGVYR